jgi:hypothetical protein
MSTLAEALASNLNIELVKEEPKQIHYQTEHIHKDCIRPGTELGPGICDICRAEDELYYIDDMCMCRYCGTHFN